MNLEDVEKYRYWVDKAGNIWMRFSYCKEPTVSFTRLTVPGPSNEENPSQITGGITGLIFDGLEPLKHPNFGSSDWQGE
jgi:hypothetical protein